MKLDRDIKRMTLGQLKKQLQRARNLVRTHKRKRNNARCHGNDDLLYKKLLPEGGKDSGFMTLPKKFLLRKCRQYINLQQRRKGCKVECALKEVCKKGKR